MAAKMVAIKTLGSYPKHKIAPKLWIGAGSNGLPPTKGVGPSSCESSDVCAGSLDTVVCAEVWTEVASVEELVEVEVALVLSRVAEVAEVDEVDE
ncbi:hypothetical protein Hte_002841, partial [Hypoxylon texense]